MSLDARRSRRPRPGPAAAACLLLAAALISASCAAPTPATAPATSADAAPAAPPAPPAPLPGEWGVQIKFFEHPVDGVLRFSTDRGAVFGSFSDNEGNQSELEKLHVEGNRISFQIDRPDGTLTAKGTIEGTIMNGKMKLRREGDSGFGVGGGGSRGYGGRRVGEPDSYAWTAVKRAESGAPPAAPAPPPPPSGA